MGIPRLLSHLEPYGVEEQLGNVDIIVDGPSLAYHIYRLGSSSTLTARNGRQGPSYSLLGDTAIAWLNRLQEGGFKVVAIYFDGFLPLAKRPTRLERLLQSSLQLQRLHATNLVFSDHGPSVESPTLPALFPTHGPRRDVSHTPPFLVPAILERLKSAERYASLVHLVPGEADEYCAEHALAHGGTILTSDSDLLIHDLGSGSVVFLGDIHPRTKDAEDPRPQGLVVSRYYPREIASRLRLPQPLEQGLIRLGYELSKDCHASLSQLLEACQKPLSRVDNDQFQVFSQPYKSLSVESRHAADIFSASAASNLDPRISELVLQSTSYQRLLFTTSPGGFATQPQGQAQEPLIFLPLLLDCPVRTSAWDSSLAVRQLAYSLFHLAYPGWPGSVREYRRIQSTANKGKSLRLLSEACTLEAAAELSSVLSHMADAFDDEPDLLWFTFALHQDMSCSHVQGEDPTTFSAIRDILLPTASSAVSRGTTTTTTTTPTTTAQGNWITLHLTAQCQAALYSLRILAQILPLVLQAAAPPAEPLAATLHSLQRLLARLPSLSEYPAASGTLALVTDLRDHPDRHLPRVASVLGLQPSDIIPRTRNEEKRHKKQQSRKRRKEQEEAARQEDRIGSASKKVYTNPFDVLGDQ
ncbi:hypothetical protein SODALDRAFT_318656 [Sodiomyces alkalinus F11]|uniref:Asteroid domain-containing protein n=1 Tax=Sodiomyces alkalinus (strain CBS 110278 / VKM F-3762 / F11) TaxID=1314773 RepID=A0A3N2Q4Z2_SODAK|nr:hypothetical protein SODALDRAFT_318656 [Sodiomyces alkalinus F11]ROT41844.1 hypothetical protein SODALDRAFT_318656 [Sodiomyces alkalinus F11]